MAQTKTNQRWAEIDSVIKEHKAELKAAESHTVLRDFAKEHGFANKEDFFKFKHSLKKIGIFYDELRDAALQVWAEELADKAKELAGRENLVELWRQTTAARHSPSSTAKMRRSGTEVSLTTIASGKSVIWAAPSSQSRKKRCGWQVRRLLRQVMTPGN